MACRLIVFWQAPGRRRLPSLDVTILRPRSSIFLRTNTDSCRSEKFRCTNVPPRGERRRWRIMFRTFSASHFVMVRRGSECEKFHKGRAALRRPTRFPLSSACSHPLPINITIRRHSGVPNGAETTSETASERRRNDRAGGYSNRLVF